MLAITVFAQASGLLIAAIFAVAGLSKLRSENMAFYRQAIDSYGLTPSAWSTTLVGALGATELGIAVLSLLPVTQNMGLIAGILLLAVYMFAFLKVIREGKAGVDCGCSGPSGKVAISYALVCRNAMLIALATMAVLLVAPMSPVLWAMTLCCFFVLALIYVSAQQLVSNGQVIKILRESRL